MSETFKLAVLKKKKKVVKNIGHHFLEIHFLNSLQKIDFNAKIVENSN
jgi:hypothetical protein